MDASIYMSQNYKLKTLYSSQLLWVLFPINCFLDNLAKVEPWWDGVLRLQCVDQWPKFFIFSNRKEKSYFCHEYTMHLVISCTRFPKTGCRTTRPSDHMKPTGASCCGASLCAALCSPCYLHKSVCLFSIFMVLSCRSSSLDIAKFATVVYNLLAVTCKVRPQFKASAPFAL